MRCPRLRRAIGLVALAEAALELGAVALVQALERSAACRAFCQHFSRKQPALHRLANALAGRGIGRVGRFAYEKQARLPEPSRQGAGAKRRAAKRRDLTRSARELSCGWKFVS